jgi:uncharacterized protein (TIGR02246 family)
MKRILIATIFIASAAFAAENPDPKAEEAIKAVFLRVDACVANRDSKCFGALFTDDATFAGPVNGGKMIKGKAQIIKAFEGMMKTPGPKGMKQKRTVENVRFVGQDRAFVDCSLTVSGEGSADNESNTYFNTALMVRKGEKWILEDVRFYIVKTPPIPTPAPLPKQPVAPTQPAQPKEPAQPDAPPKN